MDPTSSPTRRALASVLLVVLAANLSAPALSSAEVRDYRIQQSNVATGADELPLDLFPDQPGIQSLGTFYNVSSVKGTDGTYYLYAQTGWSEPDCAPPRKLHRQ